MSNGPILARRGMAVSGHPLATMEAARILQHGGSFMDAGIAASAVLATALPQATSLGGDVFMLIHHAASGAAALNGSGPAPALATPEAFPDGIPRKGPRSAVVPGIVAAWQAAHERYGRLSWAQLFDRAIEVASEGCPTVPVLAKRIADDQETLAADPGCAEIFVPQGTPLRAGDMLRQPALAETLRAIAHGGAGAFYEGRPAAAIGALMEERGGPIRATDFPGYAPEWGDPIETDYRGLTVRVHPPNSFGLLLLMQLNAIAGADGDEIAGETTARYARLMSAARGAFAEGEPLIADRRFVDVPVDELLGPAMTAKLRRMAGPPAEPVLRMGGTSALSVCDGDGDGLTFVQSIFSAFGSFVLEPESGVLLNNRLSGFKTDPNHPGVIAPGKRPPHTLNPTHALKDGRLRFLLATPGAQNQTLAMTQVIANLVDRGMSLADAIAAPRWAMDLHGTDLFLEDGAPETVLDELKALGYPIRRGTALNFGSIKGIEVMENGTLAGVADSRRDAFAAGF